MRHYYYLPYVFGAVNLFLFGNRLDLIVNLYVEANDDRVGSSGQCDIGFGDITGSAVDNFDKHFFI